MRKFVLVPAILMAMILGLWCKVYRDYDSTRTRSENQYARSDFIGMSDTIEQYESSYWSYLMTTSKYLDLFSKRIAYLNGVIKAGLGDSQKAEWNFREAAGAQENEIAFRAVYNWAEYFVDRYDLDAARKQYIEALEMSPYDVQTKINLELLLIELQKKKAKDKEKRGKAMALSDYWVRKTPDDDHLSAGQSKRIWR